MTHPGRLKKSIWILPRLVLKYAPFGVLFLVIIRVSVGWNDKSLMIGTSNNMSFASNANTAELPMVVMVVSSTMLKFSKNTLASLDTHAKGPIKVKLIALSPVMCSRYSFRSYKNIQLECEYGENPKEDGNKNQVFYLSADYLSNVKKKLHEYSRALDDAAVGSLVLFTDVDVVYLQDPFDNFAQQYNQTYQMWFQWENTIKCASSVSGSTASICSGLFYVRVSDRTRSILHQAMVHLERGETYDKGDQGAIVTALKNHRDVYQMLSCEDYPTGNMAFLSSFQPHESNPPRCPPRKFHGRFGRKRKNDEDEWGLVRG